MKILRAPKRYQPVRKVSRECKYRITKEVKNKRQKLLSQFDVIFSPLHLKRKMILDITCSGVIDNTDDSNVSINDLNESLWSIRGIKFDNKFIQKVLSRSNMKTPDPTLSDRVDRQIYFYFVFNQQKYPDFDFGLW